MALPSYPLPVAGIWGAPLPARPAGGACAGGERILKGEGVRAASCWGLPVGTACPCSLALSVLPSPVGGSALMSAGDSGHARVPRSPPLAPSHRGARVCLCVSNPLQLARSLGRSVPGGDPGAGQRPFLSSGAGLPRWVRAVKRGQLVRCLAPHGIRAVPLAKAPVFRWCAMLIAMG